MIAFIYQNNYREFEIANRFKSTYKILKILLSLKYIKKSCILKRSYQKNYF